MGTAIVFLALVGVVTLIIRSMIKDKNPENLCSAVRTASIAADIVIKAKSDTKE